METPRIAERTWYLDVVYRGVPRLIACGVLETGAGLLLVDPGPTSSLEGLERGLAGQGAGLADVHGLLLTHIHLDHAGATGTIVRRHPGVRVYVHRLGARHLIRPERLLASARRLYGDQMEPLWGAFLGVPEANVCALDGGETLDVGGRTVEVAYTPGHAVHHVSYLDRETGTAFVGDTAGMCVAGVGFILPVTPPPDVALEQWHESLATIRAWAPSRLFLTHFGPSDGVDRHLDVFTHQLDAWAGEVRASLEDDRDDEARAQAFQQKHMAVMRRQVPEAARRPYEQMGQPAPSWHGLARYWRKSAERGAS